MNLPTELRVVSMQETKKKRISRHASSQFILFSYSLSNEEYMKALYNGNLAGNITNLHNVAATIQFHRLIGSVNAIRGNARACDTEDFQGFACCMLDIQIATLQRDDYLLLVVIEAFNLRIAFYGNGALARSAHGEGKREEKYVKYCFLHRHIYK